MVLTALGGTFWVLWSPKALQGLGIFPVLAHSKKKSYCGSVTDFEMTPLIRGAGGRMGKPTGGYGVLSRSGFCGSKTLRVVHIPTGRPQGHY
jgi:hypothetical protein